MVVGCGETKKRCNPHPVHITNLIVIGADPTISKDYFGFTGDSGIGAIDEKGCMINEYLQHTVYFNPIINHSEIKP